MRYMCICIDINVLIRNKHVKSIIYYLPSWEGEKVTRRREPSRPLFLVAKYTEYRYPRYGMVPSDLSILPRVILYPTGVALCGFEESEY